MNAKVHHPVLRLSPVHALGEVHTSGRDPAQSRAGGHAGTAAPGQFRGTLFRPASAAARLPVQARRPRNLGGVRGKSAMRQCDEGGFGIGEDEADLLADSSAAPVGAGGDRDESASDDERRQEHHRTAANFAVGRRDVFATAEVGVPAWAQAAVAQGGVHELLLRATRRLMRSIDAAQAVPLHRRILRDVAAVLRAAGDRPLDIGGWPGVCTLLREASGTRGSRPGQPTALARRLNLMLPLLLQHMTRPRTPAQRAVLLARIDLACRSHPAPRGDP